MKLSTLCSWGLLIPMMLCTLTRSGWTQGTALIRQAIDNGQRVTLRGNTHPLAQARFDQGVAPGDLAMNHILMVLKRDAVTESALKAEIDALHGPNSGRFHIWLTPQQFRKAFGASEADVQTISGWLASQGFSVTGLSAGGTVLAFSGTARQVREAFQTEIHKYKVNGVEHWANASDPQVPAALAPAIAGIVSLHNFERQPLHKDFGVIHFDKSKGMWSRKASSSDGSGVKSLFTTTDSNGNTLEAIGPGDFATIYNVKPLWDAGIDGSGQTVAIVGRSAINNGDVDQFRSAFGLPATKLKIVQAGDMPGVTNAESESLLDIEWSGAVAKKATIDYVVAASTTTTDGIDLAALYAVDNNVAPILSVSYGQCELGLGTAGNTFYNDLWQQAVVEGITVLVASGDGSATTCDQGSSVAQYGLTVNGIGSTPYNVVVGGTDFNDFGGPNGVKHAQYWNSANDPATRASALSYIPEMVWNDSCANSQIYGLLGFTDGETSCNSDPAFTDGLISTNGGGGGVSSCTLSASGDPSTCSGGYDKPAWQNTAGVPDDGKRDLPDLSLFAADGITGSFYLYCNSSATPSGTCNYDNPADIDYMGGGGTSFATPAFAGMMALVNQKTGQRQGNANYVLYSLARSQFGTMAAPITSALTACSADLGNGVGASCIFQDVITGSNEVPCYNGSLNCTITTASDQYGVTSGYAATSGFDPASGLGSVNASNMVTGWAQAAVLTPTTTTLTLTPVSGAYGTAVSYTVAVAPTSGSGTPAGTGILIANKQTVGTFTLSSGTATGTLSGLVAGKYAITASYVSDGVYASSTSTGVKVNFATAATSTALVLSEVNPLTGASTNTNAVHYGAKMAATASVTGVASLAVPTGTVNFKSTGSDSQTQALSSTGTAAIATTGLAVGASETLTASYSGDSNYSGSSSSAQTVTIVKAAAAVRLASSTNYEVGHGSVTITATAYAYSVGDKPTGNLTLSINGVAYQTIAGKTGTDIVTGGVDEVAQFVVPSASLALGANLITATYSGDSNYGTATSSTLTIGYGTTAPVSAVTLTSSPSTVSTQQTVALNAVVTLGSIPATAGSVIFKDGAKTIGTAQIVRTPANSSFTAGTATLYTRLAAGSHAITATYSGLGSASTAATSSALDLSVTGVEPSSITVNAAPNAIHSSNYDFTATVLGNGYAAPSGVVSIEETSTIATLASGSPDTTTASLTYGTTKVFNLDNSAEFLVTGDLNNDGISDLIIRKLGALNCYLEVYIGKGDGTYQDAVEYPVGGASRGHEIVIADFNGDGIPDVATVNQSDGDVSVLLGNGDGTLQPAFTVLAQKSALNLVAADLNHDGIVDLLTFSVSASNVAVMLGNGDGTFQAPILSNLDFLPYSPAFADVNNDGNIDVAYTGLIDFPSLLHVALGKGDGTFGSSHTFALPGSESANAIHLADMNGDGNADAVIAGNFTGNVSVMNGDGKGNFGAGAIYIGGINQPFITNALPVDINGDGKLDIAATDSIGATVNILLNKGDGTFGAPSGFYTTLGYASEIYASDVNGDGVPDLLQTSQLNGSDQAVLLIGGTQDTIKFRDIVTDGPSGQLEQGIAAFAGDSTYGASTSSGVTFYASGALATPKILWTPLATTWGNSVPLGTGILDATTYGNISGTYTYTAQITGGSAATVIPTSSLTANGTYLLTVTFTPTDTTSYTSVSASQSLTILNPDFALSLGATGSLSVSNGTAATTTVSVNPLYAFGGFVNFTCTSPATGISCAVAPASIAPGASATVTVTGGVSTASSQAKHTSASSVGYLAGGGAAVSFLGLFMMPRKRRKHGVLGALILTMSVGVFTGCGSEGSQTSTLALTTSSADVASGSNITLTANVSTSKTVKLTGTVTFYDGSTVIGSSAIGNDSATITTSSLGVGIHTLTAQYSGDRHASTSTSAAVTQTIAGSTTVTVTGTYGSLSHSSTANVTVK